MHSNVIISYVITVTKFVVNLAVHLFHELVPSQAPQGVTAKALDPHSIMVSWQQLPRQYINGILKGYQVHFRAKTVNTSIVRNAVTVNASKVAVKIKGLEPNTEYEIWIEAFTAKGPGPESTKVSATTKKLGKADSILAACEHLKACT